MSNLPSEAEKAMLDYFQSHPDEMRAMLRAAFQGDMEAVQSQVAALSARLDALENKAQPNIDENA